MKAADEFKDKTTASNQLWQTGFTYLKVIGWGWFYLGTILDDFSRYIIAWKLCSTMKAEDVTATLNVALKASELDQAKVVHRPRLLSNNGSSYISSDLAKWLNSQNMEHTRGAPYHPMTQGKIERWHQTLKNRILLENYYLPGDLEAQIAAFVADYNHLRYHESISNLTPAVRSRKWLEFEGDVISSLFAQTESALARRWRSRHEDGYHKSDGGSGRRNAFP